MRHLLITCSSLALCGCGGILQEPKTLGELNTGYNYIPVDPLEVSVLTDSMVPSGTSAQAMRKLRYLRCLPRGVMDEAEAADAAATEAAPAKKAAKKDKPADVMDALPDHTIRMAVRQLSGSGKAGFGPVGVSASGSSYQVVMDSIFADVTNTRFAFKINGGTQSVFALPEVIPPGTDIRVIRLRGPGDPETVPVDAPEGWEEVAIPAYIGIGLRLTANLFTRKGGINLSNLTALAASADAEQSSGSLTMQSLGVYGQQVASSYGIPSELSSASVQNALVSMGAVKAIVYDRDTGTRPRLTGIYNPLPTSDPLLINKVYSALAARPIPWAPCGSS